MNFTPESILPPTYLRAPTVFIGGSIEQGKATDWQPNVIEFLEAQHGWNVSLMNPRREHWDANLRQSIDEPVFREQVTWELKHIELADAVLIWFEGGTLSPISLAEFGFLCGLVYAHRLNKLVVACSPEFWRRGNVEVMCDRYKIPLFDTIEDALPELVTITRRNHERRMGFDLNSLGS